MDLNKKAKETYFKFSFIDGNQHIASEYALKSILKLIKTFEVKNVLEVGIGIGCIADAILECSPSIDYTATEANEFCLNAIQKNIAQINRVSLYADLSQIPEGKSFDLIIIDGTDESLEKVKRMCTENSIIYIEGGRSLQLEMLKSLFKKGLHSQMISSYKNPEHGPFSSDKWTSGGQLIFPYPNLKMKLFYVNERISTFLKRKYRKLKK